MNYDPSFYDGLNKCNLRLLRSLCSALGISYSMQSAKITLITNIIAVLNV